MIGTIKVALYSISLDPIMLLFLMIKGDIDLVNLLVYINKLNFFRE
jgi:hypothetical protein